MHNKEISELRTASNFAESIPWVVLCLKVFARDNALDRALALLGRLPSAEVREQFTDAVISWREELNAVADRAVNVTRVSCPNAHEAAIGALRDLLSMIWSVFDRQAATQILFGATIDLDWSLVEANWSAVRGAIVEFPEFDATELAASVARERAKLIDKLSGQPRVAGQEVAFVPNDLQQAILAALHGRALKKQELANHYCPAISRTMSIG
jgi:hypothetical protein